MIFKLLRSWELRWSWRPVRLGDRQGGWWGGRWYPTVEEGGNKGVLLMVTTSKDGAVTGGPKFMKAPLPPPPFPHPPPPQPN